MTYEEAVALSLDLVEKGLSSQEWKRSLSEDGNSCSYRGFEERKCAVGWLIDDARYAPKLEGAWAYRVFNHGTLVEPLKSYWASTSEEERLNFSAFCNEMQNVHDSAFDGEDMSKTFRAFKRKTLGRLSEEKTK